MCSGQPTTVEARPKEEPLLWRDHGTIFTSPAGQPPNLPPPQRLFLLSIQEAPLITRPYTISHRAAALHHRLLPTLSFCDLIVRGPACGRRSSEELHLTSPL